MPIQNSQLNFFDINISLQVGDIVYYTTNGNPIGGFDNSMLANTFMFGTVISINNNSIVVEWDSDPPHPGPPPPGSYISFAKDKRINTSSLLGYYASVKFVNNSKKKIELFSIGSEISESSK
jgi:hypothetical protein